MTQAVGHIARISEHSLTRRAALIGLAAVAAPLTAGAVCIPPAEVDPMFAAIDVYRRGYAFHLECLRKADPIEEA